MTKKSYPPKPTGDSDSQQYYDIIVKFMNDKNQKNFVFPHTLNGLQRKKVHELGDKFKIIHKSVPTSNGKEVHLKKATPLEYKAYLSGNNSSKSSSKSKSKSNLGIKYPPRPQKDLDAEKYYDTILVFVTGSLTEMTFPIGLDGLQRKKIHEIAEQFQLLHISEGNKGQKTVKLTKISSEQYKIRKEQVQTFRKVIKSFREVSKLSQNIFTSDNSRGIPAVIDRKLLRDHIRYCNWNIEWMDYFFKDDSTFHKENKKNGISDVNKLCSNIGNAILEINPDILAILEGPSSLLRMELFIKTYLNDSYKCFGGINGGSQRIYILVKKDSNIKNPTVYEEGANYLAKPWYFDVKGNLQLVEYSYIRRPVIVKADVEINHELHPIIFAAVHSKSKYVAGGERLWKGSVEDKKTFIKKCIANRRKICAECARLRKCLEDTAYTSISNPLVIVSGDMNDGPGMDFFEEYYLLFDSVDVLMGNSFHRNAMLFPLLNQNHFVAPKDQYSCIFNDYVDDIPNKKVMLDHIFVSERMQSVAIQATFAHELWDRYVLDPTKPTYVDRQNYLSDHRPCFADFAISCLEPDTPVLD